MTKYAIATSIIVMAANAVADTTPLTIGSLAPKLDVAGFIRGEPLAELSPGKVYVLEFTGTTCAPCIALIPQMEELVRKHQDVIFLSVFSEEETVVRDFLENAGKSITMRVACDPDHKMWNTWSEPAIQIGIPHVFVVGADGKIAWIGYPEDLAEPLAKIVAGKYDDSIDRMRLEIKQHAVLRQRRIRQLETNAQEENERITPLMRAKPEEALKALDSALMKYREFPEWADIFKARKLIVLGIVPGRRDDAYLLAREIAVDATMDGTTGEFRSASYALMNHFENATPENRDKRMLHLAFALLNDPKLSAVTPGSSPSAEASDRIAQLAALGRAHRLHGDEAHSADFIREAIAAIEEQIRLLKDDKEQQIEVENYQESLRELRQQISVHEAKQSELRP